MILTINCGSSSIKSQLFDNDVSLASVLIGEIGSESYIRYEGEKVFIPMKDHTEAIKELLKLLQEKKLIENYDQITAVGHRVVHGAEYFSDSVVLTEDIIAKVEECNELAPLHNPPNIVGIRACQSVMPDALQVGVFDTAFHQTMPKSAYMYPIPYEYYEKYKIRKYGFHGTSHKFISEQAALQLGKPLTECNLITCHLGNGASLAAIRNGKSVNTTMGFTPLAGVMMGTRSGNIDPAIISFIAEKEGKSASDVISILNKKSGFAGFTDGMTDCYQITNLAREGNERAQLALDKFVHRVREYIGAYFTDLPGVDAIIFTGGIGENSRYVREHVLEGLGHMGVELDKEANDTLSDLRKISTAQSKVQVFIIPTNEELMIAKETKRLTQ